MNGKYPLTTLSVVTVLHGVKQKCVPHSRYAFFCYIVFSSGCHAGQRFEHAREEHENYAARNHYGVNNEQQRFSERELETGQSQRRKGRPVLYILENAGSVAQEVMTEEIVRGKRSVEQAEQPEYHCEERYDLTDNVDERNKRIILCQILPPCLYEEYSISGRGGQHRRAPKRTF